MKFSSTIVSASLLGLATASPLAGPANRHRPVHRRSTIHKREVPQEHSHDFVLTITNEFLALNNPKGITDAVFGLLGNAAAADGAGKVTDLDCLKQETADQAFSNAKAASDLRGMAGALLYQAIERNSGTVGGASVLCTQTAVNAEIGALTQHQDAASENAGALNKAITLELSKQLAAIGADPNLALLSGTFAPGDPADSTGAGNSCDDPEPDLGCIFSQGLLVLDASQEEVAAAAGAVAQSFTGTGGIFATDLVDLATFDTATVTGSVDLATVVNGAAGGAANATVAAPAATASGVACPVAAPATTTAAVVATPATTATAVATGAAGGTNVQAFAGALGGPPPPVESTTGDRPFSVNGDTFVGEAAALARSCDVQHNACFDAVNSGQLAGDGAQCEQQVADCKAANALKKRRVF